MVPLLVAGAVLWADAGRARAEILLTLTNGSPTNNGNGTFTYSYNVFLTGGYELDTNGGGLNTMNGFTLYDLAGYVPGSATSNASGFGQSGVSEQLVGITPPATAPVDSPSVVNATFRYTSSTETNNDIGSPDLFLGTVSFLSTDGTVGDSNIMYAAAAQKNTPGSPSDESFANDVSLVSGPVLVMPIPAPPAVVLFGSGLPFLGAAFLRWRKRLLNLA
jgi:hypothetical protein